MAGSPSWALDAPASAAVTARTHFASFGGVGTSALMVALSAAGAMINNGGDCDGIKHLSFGRLMREKASHMFKNPPVARILYVYDDPTDAVMSLFRRGYNWDQQDKTRSELPAPVSPETLREYADRDDDPFQFEAHFDSFAAQREYPIAFVQQSHVLQHVGDLADFLQLDNGTLLRLHLETVVGKRPKTQVALLARVNRTALGPSSRRAPPEDVAPWRGARTEPAWALQPSESPAQHQHASRHSSIMLFGTLGHACQHCAGANRTACTAGQCSPGKGDSHRVVRACER